MTTSPTEVAWSWSFTAENRRVQVVSVKKSFTKLINNTNTFPVSGIWRIIRCVKANFCEAAKLELITFKLSHLIGTKVKLRLSWPFLFSLKQHLSFQPASKTFVNCFLLENSEPRELAPSREPPICLQMQKFGGNKKSISVMAQSSRKTPSLWWCE